jgi:hypothetical protein
MRKLRFNCRRDLLSSTLLALLLFRAYVPVGFMPASGTPFLLELCPAASSIQVPAHHHHHTESHTHFEHCPFGSAPAAGPISQLSGLASTGQVASQIPVTFESVRLGVQLPRAHQARGPPSLA